MATAGSASEKEVVLLIHGVGDPHPGDIREAVYRNLGARTNNFHLIEFNWNAPSLSVLSGNTIKISAMRELAITLARVSDVEAHVEPKEAAHCKKCLQVHNAAFVFTKYSLVALVATYFLILPLFAVMKGLADQAGLIAFHIPATRIIAYEAALGLITAGLFVVTGVVAAFLMRKSRMLWITLRRLLVLCCRPVAVLCIPLFFISWKGVARFGRGLFVIIVPIVLAAPLLIYPLVIWLGEKPGKSDWAVVAALEGAMIGVATTILLCCFALAFMVSLLVGPALKILLDIFRYIGLPDYRDAIQTSLLNGVKQYARRRITIVSHSLGSVIALDLLLNAPDFPRDCKVTLVTCGSPLRRFFWRFFPGLLFPDSGPACAETLSRRLLAFRWLNCFRPFDQIGCRLGLTQTCCRDVSTKQMSRVWTAHLDYWGDPDVREMILEELATLQYSSVPVEERVIPRIWMSSLPRKHNARDIQMLTFLGRLVVLTIVSGFLVGLCLGIKGYVQLHRTITAKNTKLATRGAITRATVWHSRQGIVYGDRGESHTDYFSFMFSADNGQPVEEKAEVSSVDGFENPYSSTALLFDSGRLLDSILSQGKCLQSLRGQPRVAQSCALQLEVRYVRGEPEVFDLPAFTNRVHWWTGLGWLLLGALFSAIFIGPGLLTAVFKVGLPWIRMLVGVDVLDTKR